MIAERSRIIMYLLELDDANFQKVYFELAGIIINLGVITLFYTLRWRT